MLFFFSACNAVAIPQIGNGTVNTTGSDTAPYFVGEVIRYQCNANFSAPEANLTNECIASSMGGGAPADWSRNEGSLASVCQPGKTKICFTELAISVASFDNELELIQNIIGVGKNSFICTKTVLLKVDTSCIFSHIGSPRWIDDLVLLWEYRRKVFFSRTKSLQSLIISMGCW